MSNRSLSAFLSSLLMTGVLTGLSVLPPAVFAVDGDAPRARLELGLGTPEVLAGANHKTWLKIGLTGFERAEGTARTPVNVALVLDRSGSMQGEKLRRAREAAILAIDLLDARDVVSIIAYDDGVETLIPATRLDERAAIKRAIRGIQAGGSTALFAGVSKGARQLRKFLSEQRVNRVILLSDGQANVGPSSPSELGELGSSLAREGISVTTIGLGLGYNEDLMTQLAQRSDGNHAFVENGNDLARVFRSEFGDVLSVVAQDVSIRIVCPPNVKPLRLIGREGEIRGQQVVTSLRQLYAGQQKYVMLELEVPAAKPGERLPVASIDASYRNMQTGETDHLAASSQIRYSSSRAAVEAARDANVLGDALEQVSVKEAEAALRLRDEGRKKEARKRLKLVAEELKQRAQEYKLPRLESMGQLYEDDAEAVTSSGQDWSRARKAMRKDQYLRKNQTSY